MFCFLWASLSVLPAAASEPPRAYGPAPELRTGLEWINADQALRLADLRETYVLLSFWSYGDVPSLQMLPDVQRLADKYPRGLKVLGVHAARFPAERETALVDAAVQRYGITYPVVNDAPLKIWRDFGVKAWPVLVLIDPHGQVIYRGSGTDAGDQVDSLLGEALQRYGPALDRPARKGPVAAREGQVLSFPGQVLADATGKRLFIADTGHHRILITDFSGRVLEIIGQGTDGWEDGDFQTARFSEPQGMALAGDVLFVADRANQLIRFVDLRNRRVTTAAGTRQDSRDPDAQGNLTGLALASPWGLVWRRPVLYVSMAGAHQIWALDFSSDRGGVYAGTGQPDLRDGSLKTSSLVQPLGLLENGDALYFLDSGGSALRRADLRRKGKVTTLVGQGLFEYGDKDGRGERVRLQHPQALAELSSRQLAIADTYNNKIKIFDLSSSEMRTLAGEGTPGWRDGSLLSSRFNQPGGLSCAEGKVFVADTNNHRIRVIDVTLKTVETLNLQ